MWGCGVSCPEPWGNMMLGWKREEGRAPGSGSHQLSPTGPVGSNPWAGRKMQGKGGHVGKVMGTRRRTVSMVGTGLELLGTVFG